MPEQYDEDANFLDAWQADPDRQRSEYFESVRKIEMDPPSAVPEMILLSALAGVLAVLAYLALTGIA